jgi:hypothetical protein
MSLNAIDPTRVAPVTADLTLDDDAFQVLRGLESMHRVDKKLVDLNTTTLLKGEWAVLNSDDKVQRPGATGVRNSYPVFCGTDRFDVHATGAVTLIMGPGVIFKTTVYDPAGSYTPGVKLAAKSGGTGQAWLAPVVSAEACVAVVQTVGTGYLICEMANA